METLHREVTGLFNMGEKCLSQSLIMGYRGLLPWFQLQNLRKTFLTRYLCISSFQLIDKNEVVTRLHLRQIPGRETVVGGNQDGVVKSRRALVVVTVQTAPVSNV